MSAKILIVEDDPLMSRVYQRIFKLEGYEIVTAQDGEEGLKKATETNPVLIMLDIMMPKMNGLDILQKLKSQDSTKTIPIIMLTNLAGQEDAKKVISMGAAKYKVKSEYKPSRVTNMVKEVLNSQNTQNPTQTT
jgi:DNA-binding response OmpR family regulator